MNLMINYILFVNTFLKWLKSTLAKGDSLIKEKKAEDELLKSRLIFDAGILAQEEFH